MWLLRLVGVSIYRVSCRAADATPCRSGDGYSFLRDQYAELKPPMLRSLRKYFRTALRAILLVWMVWLALVALPANLVMTGITAASHGIMERWPNNRCALIITGWLYVFGLLVFLVVVAAMVGLAIAGVWSQRPNPS